GNLGTGRCRTAMYTDSIEQLRGAAGARQVRVRAETALAAFTTPSSGGWIMFGKIPELTACGTGVHRLAAITLSASLKMAGERGQRLANQSVNRPSPEGAATRKM